MGLIASVFHEPGSVFGIVCYDLPSVWAPAHG